MSSFSGYLFQVLQAKRAYVRRLGLFGRVDVALTAEATTAYTALRLVCLPYEGPLARHALGWRASARRLEGYPYMCPKNGAEMKVIAIIEDPDELKRILRHPGCRAAQQPEVATRLIKIGQSPLGLDFGRLN